jgi:hypothetical protein
MTARDGGDAGRAAGDRARPLAPAAAPASATLSAWIEREPGWADAGRAFLRLARRARRRWAVALFLLLSVTGFMVVRRARKIVWYDSQLVLRVTEGDLDVATAPRSKQRLREYVRDSAFSAPRLLGIIQRRHLYRPRAEQAPMMAVELMRSDITVEVYRNYFLEERMPGDPPRSARISITYRARDPEVAVEVVRDLGQLVARTEIEARQAAAQAALAEVDGGLAEVDAERARLSQEASQLEIQLRDTPAAARKSGTAVRLMTLRSAIAAEEDQATVLMARRSALDLRVDFEQQERGLRFDIADDARELRGTPLSRVLELSSVAAAGLLLGLPLVLIAVGAFDGRVYDTDDVRHLGLTPLGHIPAFAGARTGTLGMRTRRDRVE